MVLYVRWRVSENAPYGLRKRSRKPGLDQPPARREIMIARRQLPDRMQMIGQHNNGVDRKGMVFAGHGDRLAQACDMVDEQGFPSLQQVDRKEPASARNERATIVWHGTQDSTCYSCGTAKVAG